MIQARRGFILLGGLLWMNFAVGDIRFALPVIIVSDTGIGTMPRTRSVGTESRGRLIENLWSRCIYCLTSAFASVNAWNPLDGVAVV